MATSLTSTSRLIYQENSVQSWLKSVVKQVSKRLSPNWGPVISLRKTPQGDQFHVYDPVTEQRHIFSSNPEMMAWMEKRY